MKHSKKITITGSGIPLLCTLALFLLSSCGGDDEVIADAHEVGEWSLDQFILSNLPPGFTSLEGNELEVNEITFGEVVITQYELTLFNDGRYTRSIDIDNSEANLDDFGMWVLEDDELILTTNDDVEEVWDVVLNEEDQLQWSTTATFGLLHDSVTQEDLTGITEAEFNSLINNVQLDLIYAFSRK